MIEGVALIAVGTVLLVLPGPGIPILAAGILRVRSAVNR
jgi:hypothetical protein